MISVIVPVYHVEPYLRQCVDSILGQTETDLEVLLIDDGSPDGCGAICDDYARRDGRVRVFHTENRGLSAARNLGLRNAGGEFVSFVDADDWPEPDMLETLLGCLEENGADVAVCGRWDEVPAGAPEKKPAAAVYDGKDALRALLDEKIDSVAWNKLYRTELFEGIEYPEGKNYEDVAVMHRLLGRAGKTVVTAAPLYHYRIRPESITKTYTAKNLVDLADASLARYAYFRDEEDALFREKQDELQQYTAKNICKAWRWWHGCTAAEKEEYAGRIEELKGFSRAHFPRFGGRAWPAYLRVCCPFMRSSSPLAFACLYAMNQANRRLAGRRAQ